MVPEKVSALRTPATLFVGALDTIKARMITYASETYGTDVTQAAAPWSASHPSLRWILPAEKAYRRSDLEPFFGEVYRSRAADFPVFYLFPQAELLNESCANSMLKVLEEPPSRTHFLLGAPCVDFVLPTIVSRCVLVALGGERHASASTLIDHFLRKTPQSYGSFMKLIENEEIDERKTRLLLDQLSVEYSTMVRDALCARDDSSRLKGERALRVLTYAYDRLPMPGSTKIFWRTLYLLL